MSVKAAKKVNRKTSGEPKPKAPRSSGGIPDKSPHWVSLDALSRGWVRGEELRTGKTGLLKKYAVQQASRVKTSTYESACWGALRDCGMHDAARNLQVMVLDQKLPLRFAEGRHEIYLGFIEDVKVAMAWAAKAVAAGLAGIADVRKKAGLDAIAAPKQRVKAPCARAQAKPKKASQARAGARTAPKRRPTRG